MQKGKQKFDVQCVAILKNQETRCFSSLIYAVGEC